MEERKFSEKRVKNIMLMLAATAGLAAAIWAQTLVGDLPRAC